MLHGLSSSPLEMRHLARYLNSEGLTACAPNLHGYSAGTSELRMEAWLEAAVREFDALSARYPRVSVCGLSMGATLALALVRERPSVQAIVLLSVTLKYDGWAMPWYRFLLGWAYYTPLRQRWRYKEESPFGLTSWSVTPTSLPVWIRPPTWDQMWLPNPTSPPCSAFTPLLITQQNSV